MKVLAIAFFAAVVAFAAPAARARTIRQIIGVNGTCGGYQTPLRALAGRCGSHVFDEEFDDGSVSFTYIVRGATKADTAIIAFFGNGRQEIHQGPEHVVLPISQIFIISHRIDTSLPAVGTCTFGNPFAGSVGVNCTANTSQGTYRFTFTTDGLKPHIFR